MSRQTSIRYPLARAASTPRWVTHPHVCHFFGLGDDGDIRFPTMEIVEGRTLRAFLFNGGVAPELALRILEQIAAGLVAAHARGSSWWARCSSH